MTALVAAALTACAGARTERVLPADRTAPLLYVALGDSTVEGIGATSAATTYVGRLGALVRGIYPAARTTNLGVAGATSADVLGAQLPQALALAPDLVTLSVGPNDVTGGVDVARYEANVDAILGRLARDTQAVVVVNLLPDLGVTPRFRGTPDEARVRRLAGRFNDALRRAARAHRAEVVDLYAASQAEVPRRPELVAADGYHPSDAGYERWAALMWQAIGRHIAAR